MRNAIWRKCSGEAHGGKLVRPTTRRGTYAADAGKGRCTNSACASARRWFSLANEPTKHGSLVWLGCTFVEIGVRMIHGMTCEDCYAGH